MTRILQITGSALLLFGLLMAGGCSWGFGGGNPEIPEMHKDFSRTVDIQTAVVQGKMDRAQRAASWILEHRDQRPFPPEAEAYRKEMLGYASRIAEAEDMTEVASQTGRMAGACGSCHQSVGGGPRFVVGTPSPDGSTQAAQMIRHLWAADRMWEGLVGPSDEAWMAGARAMAETQPAMVGALPASTAPGTPQILLREVNLLGTEAMNAKGTEARADVYGRLLETCNRCHAPTGILAEK